MPAEDQDKRHIILDAARHVFLRWGYAKTTISDIARQAMVGKGSLYYYFESKEDVFVELVTQEAEEFYNQVTKMMNACTTVREKFKMLMVDVFELMDEYTPLVQEVRTNPPLRMLARFKEFKIRMKQRLLNTIDELIEEAKMLNLFRREEYIADLPEVLMRQWFFMEVDDFQPSNCDIGMAEYLTKDYRILADIFLDGLLKEQK